MSKSFITLFSAAFFAHFAYAATITRGAVPKKETQGSQIAKAGAPIIPLAPNPSRVVSQIVAAAKGHAFTSRESQISLMIDYMTNVKPSGDLLAKPGTETFDQNITKTVLDWLADQEAQSFKATELTTAEIQDTQKKVMIGINTPAIVSTWNSLEVTSGELKNLILRHLSATKFIGFKSRASYLPITDEEAETYFKANKGRFGDEPFSKFRDDIKSILAKKRSNDRMDEWFSILQKKYKVRFFPTAVAART